MRIRICGYLLILCLAAGWSAPAAAQGGGGAYLGAVQLDQFPTMQTQLKVFDAQGRFVQNLTADQVEMLEDGSPQPVDSIVMQRPGVQMVVAINPGPSFAIRNRKAVSRYDLIKTALRDWAASRAGSSLDDYSLLITNGASASHLKNPLQWVAALDLDAIDARRAVPTFDILNRAILLASDNTPRPGMGRMVLFITPPPDGPPNPQALENLAAQANENGIPITIWLVSSTGAVMTQAAQQMMQLASATGGRFYTFTGDQPAPDIEADLEPLRLVYDIEYTSAVAISGSHSVAARVQAGEASIETAPVQIEVNLAPPAPVMAAPPAQILRRIPEVAPDAAGNSSTRAAIDAADFSGAALMPQSLTLQIDFNFPDGRKRAIAYSALLVDGVVVAENNLPPFDRLTWNLESYTVSGVHQLQVQARDGLGLTGSSPEFPVQITVDKPKGVTFNRLRSNLPVIAALLAVLAGGALFLVMVMGGKLRPRSHYAAQRRKIYSDPVTQPVRMSGDSAARRSGWMERFQFHRPPAALQTEAYFNPVADADQRTLPPIPIPAEGFAIGSDPSLAELTLDDASVDALHARLTRQEDGSYRLADAGSVAGVWVNYTPVSPSGARLEHGDLVHIGRIGFRFTLRQPGSIRKPVVIAAHRENSLDDEDETV